MLELICQQRYRVAGQPVDLTPYRNHGIATGTGVATGPASGDAISFDAINSAVHIPSGSAGGWQPLTALKIEVDVRVPDIAVARTLCLIEGDSAFRFQIFEHAIEAGLFTGGGIPETYLRAGDAYSPDHGSHPLPPNRWVTVGLYHDGFAKAQLTMDGRLVAETLVSGSVAGVSGGGVSIGNSLAGNTPLHGAISEVRIWRLDPQTVRREFLCRPVDATTAACLAAAFREVREWMAAYPNAAAALVSLVKDHSARAGRALYLLPDQERGEAHQALNTLTKLWCSGDIAGEAMETAFSAWLLTLDKAGVPSSPSADMARINDIVAAAPFPTLTIDCDPALRGFVERMSKVSQPMQPTAS